MIERKETMIQYEMIKKEDLGKISKEELLEKYNDAVETIWFCMKTISDLESGYDNLMGDYDMISEQLYG